MDYRILDERISVVRERIDQLEELSKKLRASGPRDRVHLKESIKQKITQVKGAAEDLFEGVTKGPE